MSSRRTLVVWPERGNSFHARLGRDVGEALQADVLDSAELGELLEPDLHSTVLLVVYPFECALSGARFRRVAAAARRRVAIVAEPVQSAAFARQFESGLRIDDLFDVGFASQAGHDEARRARYHFVFDGRRPADRFVTPTKPRRIPWAVADARHSGRARLVEDLTRMIAPDGFAFVPELGTQNGRPMPLSQTALHSVLAQADTYVWPSSGYYESSRFREALLAGAAPCAIGAYDPGSALPGTYEDVSELHHRLQTTGTSGLLSESIAYYERNGTLAEHLRGAYDDLDR